RDLLALRALWLAGDVRDGLSACRKSRRTAGHQSDGFQESWDPFHRVQPTIATSTAHWPRAKRPPHLSLYQNTCSPSAISASGESRMTSERTFFAPRISTSD